jgi:hypothetical protein
MAGSQSELIDKLQAENAYLRQRLDINQKEEVRAYAPLENQAAQCAGQMQSPESVIDFLFTFHDDPDKTPHYVEIRESAKQFAKVVIRHTPFGGPDRVTAVQKIREAVMFANACVALSGRGL